MASSTPIVSVTMPVLNRRHYVAEAIDSLLAQTMADWELVVSDGGSTDGTMERLREYAAGDARIRVVSNSRLSIPAARNSILPHVRGEFIAVLDSDDIAYPERLAAQTAFLRHNPDIAGIGSGFDFIDDSGALVAVDKYKQRLTDPVELRRRQRAGWSCFVHSTMLIRRSAMEEVGGYREIFPLAEDDDLFLRLLDRHKLANLPDRLAAYRWHGGNTTGSLSSQIHRVAAVASAHLRLAGLSDLVDGRRKAIDYAFLKELLSALDGRSLPVWLMWIGLLQFYRHGEPGMLEEAWDAVFPLPDDPEQRSEVLRHWTTYRTNFPDDWEKRRALLARDGGGQNSVGGFLRSGNGEPG